MSHLLVEQQVSMMVDVKERPLSKSALMPFGVEHPALTLGRCIGAMQAQGWHTAAQQLALEYLELKRRRNPCIAIAARARQLAPVKL